jgi:hypothetical protein
VPQPSATSLQPLSAGIRGRGPLAGSVDLLQPTMRPSQTPQDAPPPRPEVARPRQPQREAELPSKGGPSRAASHDQALAHRDDWTTMRRLGRIR